ncbi:hypothetical protein FJTKL_00317 [Diaporthe vaccinii]|uniref:Secreted protein n=1 Tax=Diaporthe vaccinii TaxID=105482 RepID=A0ABR4E3N0_9PEZI
MTYAHLVPRACACAGACACLLQKPCCFLVSYKNKNERRPLLCNLGHSHNHINTFYISTLPPINKSPTRTTVHPANMPTYIVSPNQPQALSDLAVPGDYRLYLTYPIAGYVQGGCVP